MHSTPQCGINTRRKVQKRDSGERSTPLRDSYPSMGRTHSVTSICLCCPQLCYHLLCYHRLCFRQLCWHQLCWNQLCWHQLCCRQLWVYKELETMLLQHLFLKDWEVLIIITEEAITQTVGCSTLLLVAIGDTSTHKLEAPICKKRTKRRKNGAKIRKKTTMQMSFPHRDLKTPLHPFNTRPWQSKGENRNSCVWFSSQWLAVYCVLKVKVHSGSLCTLHWK